MSVLKFPEQYDVVIAGGGLAGLSLSIQLKLSGKTVLVIEKGNYPIHRVCGEYLSEESRKFLTDLGIQLYAHNLPQINKLVVTGAKSGKISSTLAQGGFGISRYKLDWLLYQRAVELGVDFSLNTRVLGVFTLIENIKGFETTEGRFSGKDLVVATGKLPFGVRLKNSKRKKFLGVKYHVTGVEVAQDTIELHNFKGGYMGVSAIEEGKYCMCYLAELPKDWKGNIKNFEQETVWRNSHIKALFHKAQFVFNQPVTMSHFELGFAEKTEEGIYYLGDAQGVIAPLCGNGMSIAFKSAYWAAKSILGNGSTQEFDKNCKGDFGGRIVLSEWLHKLLGSERLTDLAIRTFVLMPFLVPILIKKTHGKPFSAIINTHAE